MVHLNDKSPLPYYRQIEEWFRAEIAGGRLAVDDVVPDENTLAQRLGLSRMTVRRAIVTLTEEGLLYRIRGRGTFVKGSTAPGTKKVVTVGVVTSLSQTILRQSFFYYRILQGLQEATSQHDLALVHHTLREPLDTSASEFLRESKRDALIVLAVIDQPALKTLAASKLPLVLVDSTRPEGFECDSVSHTGAESSYRAVEHLLELGHRDIGLLTFGPTPAALERKSAFERAMNSRGIQVAPERILVCECNGSAAYAAVRRMLNEPSPPTALFCTTDELALGAISAIKDCGWRVPQEISVVGYGDLGYFSQPALSSIRIALEEMGSKAAEVLRARIDRRDAPPVKIVFSSEFVARASSDLPRASVKSRGNS